MWKPWRDSLDFRFPGSNSKCDLNKVTQTYATTTKKAKIKPKKTILFEKSHEGQPKISEERFTKRGKKSAHT